MTTRRSHERFSLGQPADGRIRFLQDVVVHEAADSHLVIVSRSPGLAGEVVTLDLIGRGTSAAFTLRVAESRPVIIDGLVRHRLSVNVIEVGPDDEVKAKTRARALAAGDFMGILGREVAVHVVNLSAAGCLMEGTRRVERGTSGVLRFTLDAESYTEDLLVTRCQPVAGGGARYRIGGEFLWTSHPGPLSLRGGLSRLGAAVGRRALDTRSESPRPM